MGGLQCLEFTEQRVVLSVAEARTVLHVVLVLMQMNRLTQLVQALHDSHEVFHRAPQKRRVGAELKGVERPWW
jgi:hypothetical protein